MQLSGASFSVQRAALSGPCLCPQFEALLLGSRSLCCQACPQSPLCHSRAGAQRRRPGPCTPPQIRSLLVPTPCFPPLSCVWKCCVLLVFCLVSCPPHCLSHGCPLVWAFCLLVLGPSLTHRALCSAPESGQGLGGSTCSLPAHLGLGSLMQASRLSRTKPSSGEVPPAGP